MRGSLQRIFHMTVFYFELPLACYLPENRAVRSLESGFSHIEIIKHAGYRGTPVEYKRLIFIIERKPPDIISIFCLPGLFPEINAGKIRGFFYLYNPVAALHRKGTASVRLLQKHLILKHLMRINIPPVFHHIPFRVHIFPF